MKKPSASAKQAGQATGWTDAAFAKAYPKLTEYLSTEKWEDGTKRTPSALSLTGDGNGVQLALNDKELKQSLYCTAGTLAEALVLLEEVLVADTGNWRSWKAGKGR